MKSPRRLVQDEVVRLFVAMQKNVGMDTWNGTGPGWKKHPEVKAALTCQCRPVDRDDGVFWISKEEFFTHYKNIELCARNMTEFLDDDLLGVPKPWTASTDTATGRAYYFNEETHQTLWGKPLGSMSGAETRIQLRAQEAARARRQEWASGAAAALLCVACAVRGHEITLCFNNNHSFENTKAGTQRPQPSGECRPV